MRPLALWWWTFNIRAMSFPMADPLAIHILQALEEIFFSNYSAQAVIQTLGVYWEGFRPMIMGNTAGALPPGTYWIAGGPTPPPPPPPPQGTPDSPVIWIINAVGKAFTNTSADDPRAHPLAACPAPPPGLTPGVFHVISALGGTPAHDLQRETNSNELTQIVQRGLAQEWVEIGQYPDNCYYIKVAGGCAYIQESSWRNTGPGPLQLSIQYFGKCNNVGGGNGNDEWAIRLNTGNNLYVIQSKRSSLSVDRRSQDNSRVANAFNRTSVTTDPISFGSWGGFAISHRPACQSGACSAVDAGALRHPGAGPHRRFTPQSGGIDISAIQLWSMNNILWSVWCSPARLHPRAAFHSIL